MTQFDKNDTDCLHFFLYSQLKALCPVLVADTATIFNYKRTDTINVELDWFTILWQAAREELLPYVEIHKFCWHGDSISVYI